MPNVPGIFRPFDDEEGDAATFFVDFFQQLSYRSNNYLIFIYFASMA
jgi:hypothetical protein